MSSRDTPLFWKIGAAWPPQKTKPDHWVSWAVVHQKWKLVANKDLSHLELYDISNDVAEGNDLSRENESVVRDLLAKLEAWHTTLPEKPAGNVFSREREEL
jgi:N-acetylgalactosamine-6-sulfatase